MPDDNQNLAALKRTRAGLRASVTRACNKLEEALSSQEAVQVSAALSLLERRFKDLEIASSACHVASDITEDDVTAMFEEEDAYTLAYEVAREKANKFLTPPPTPQLPVPADPARPKPVKLERLSLPSFNGDVLQFTEFWPTFKARVHNSPELDDSDKFGYLVSKLSGPALAAVHGLPHTTAGYNQAIELLLNRFGRRAPIINTRINEMMRLPSLDDSAGPQALRSFSDKLHLSVRSLESLGVDINNASEILGPVLLSRFPPAMRIRWMETHPADARDTIDNPVPGTIKVDALLAFLALQVEHRELGVGASNNKSIPKPPPPTTRQPPSTGSAFAADGMRNQKCPICQSNDHGSANKCQTFLNYNPQERENRAKKVGLCLNCLSPRHSAKECKSEGTCRHCHQRHNTLLCRTVADRDKGVPSAHNLMLCEGSSDGVHPTLIAWARGRHQDLRVQLLLDGCSNQTFITPECARRMNFPVIGKGPMTVNHFNKGSVSHTMEICEVKLKSIFDNKCITLNAYIIDLCHPIQSGCINLSAMPHTKGLKFAENYSKGEPKVIDILVGFDFLYQFLTDEVCWGPRGTPVALGTHFGWVLHGPYTWRNLKPLGATAQVFHVQRVEDPADKCLERFSDLELVGVAPSELEMETWPEPKVVEGRYEVELPWKSSSRPVCNKSKVLAYQRNVYGRLSPAQSREYDQYFHELEELNIIEPCPIDSPQSSWFLPHHGVWRRGKLRVVFDGSNGKPPLNQLLDAGPNLLLKLPTCLTSFRLRNIPLAADIEKAFLQVAVCHTDRDYLKFLVLRNGSYHAYRFRRTPFGLCSSPSLLNSCLKDLYDKNELLYPETVSRLRESMYCDDLVTSLDSFQEVSAFQMQCNTIFDSVKMNLRGWSSQPGEVLGLKYDHEHDTLSIHLEGFVEAETKRPSRRSLLSSIAKVFDPLGFLTPWLLRGKLLMQRAWEPTGNWDSLLPEQILAEWKSLIQEATNSHVTIPRHLRHGSGVELHAFSDASGCAYATCIYLVGNGGSNLVFARSRLKPRKSIMSIPRLELMGALLSVRAVRMLTTSLADFKSLPVYLWTDSTCVLSWVQTDPLILPRFVQNRVKEIQSIPSSWQFVPGESNPADLATRGASLAKLGSSSLWCEGPGWLSNSSCWPDQPPMIDFRPSEATACPVTAELPEIERVCSNVSDLRTIEGACAWMMRFCHNVMLTGSQRAQRKTGPLQYAERALGLEWLISQVQESHFKQEIDSLKINPFF